MTLLYLFSELGYYRVLHSNSQINRPWKFSRMYYLPHNTKDLQNMSFHVRLNCKHNSHLSKQSSLQKSCWMNVKKFSSYYFLLKSIRSWKQQQKRIIRNKRLVAWEFKARNWVGLDVNIIFFLSPWLCYRNTPQKAHIYNLDILHAFIFFSLFIKHIIYLIKCNAC